MLYVDTSVIVKLYVREEYSQEAADWLKENDESLPLTPFHELEFTNAINLKLFRKELTEAEAEKFFEQLTEHEQRGVYHRAIINWPEALARCITLSKSHTSGIGSRSLDIVHVALAHSISADVFFTFDDRQALLASGAGLRVITHSSF